MFQQRVRECRLKSRGTFRALSAKTGLPTATSRCSLEGGDLNSEGRKIRPFLTAKNRIDSVKWCMYHVESYIPSLPFCSMLNKFHIGEKWFFQVQLKSIAMVVPGESINKTSLKS